MKKTISINIKGLNFIIEEDAYELLSEYLKRLETYLKNQKGWEDIFEDIELRIAELAQEKILNKKEVLELTDIESILQTLGRPEDYLDEADSTENTFQNTENADYQKKFYRDLENGKIAGICAGLSTYLSVDIIIVRIVFLVFLFFAGFGFPLYLILWLVVPKTNSSIDRLKMHGKPITVDSVKEEIEFAASKFSSSSKSFAERIRKNAKQSKKLERIGNFITKIVGLAFIGLGLAFLVGFLVFILGAYRFLPFEENFTIMSLNKIGQLIFKDNSDISLAWIGISLFCLSTILFLVSTGVFFIFKVKNKWTKFAGLGLFSLALFGFFLCVYLGFKTGREFTVESKVEKVFQNIELNELYLEVLDANNTKSRNYTVKFDHENNQIIQVANNKIIQEGIHILYTESKDSAFHIKQEFSSQASSAKNALRNAQNIQHYLNLKENRLQISSNYSSSKEFKLRNQKVTLIIEIPKGKSAYFAEQKIDFEVNPEHSLQKYGYLKGDNRYEEWD